VLAGCSSDGDDGDAADVEPATTTSAAPAPDRFTERGPYAVGSGSLTLPDGRRVVVWYPADPDAPASAPSDVFDIAALLSPELQAQIPDGARPQHEIDAVADAEPAAGDGPFPLVLFSHGFLGFPEQSADLTTHVASWGFVVAAPDHVERSLGGLLGTAAQGIARSEDVEVLQATIVAVGSSPFGELLDVDALAVIGHSAGALAAYQLAQADDRVDGFVSYAGAGGAPPPSAPGMVMLGSADGVVPPDASRELYELLAAPKYEVEIAGAGHLVFSDVCLIGADGGGIIAIADSIGLPIPEDARRLGRDGCGPEATPVVDAFPAINHLTVAFLRRALLGLDDAGALDPSVADRFGVDVTLTAELQ
jgi:dienelactone hydrolase